MIYETQAGTIKGIGSPPCCPASTYLHFIPDGGILGLSSQPTSKEMLFFCSQPRQVTGKWVRGLELLFQGLPA